MTNNSFRPARRFVLFLFLISFALCGTVLGQDSGAMPAGQAPGAPAGSYPLGDLDTINFFNGHLNFHLPLVAVGGRGSALFTVPFVAEQTWVMESYFNQATQSNVYYESDSWRKGLDPGFGPGVVQGYTARFYQPDQCNLQNMSGVLTHPQTLSYLTFTSPNGTQYNLYSPHGRANHQPCDQSGFSRGRVFTSADGSTATFISDADVIDYAEPNSPTEFTVSGYLLLRDGTRYRVIDSRVREVRDRNGNRLTVDLDANGRVHTLTDSLGRVVTINYNVQEGGQYGTNTQIVFSGFGGIQRVVRLSQTQLHGALRNGYSVQPHGVDATPYDPVVTSSVWLPDGRRYKLFYNDMGELARVELPTGGAVEYDHEGGLVGGDPEGIFEGQPDNANGNYVHIYRRLVERRVYTDGGTGSAWAERTTISKPEGVTAAQTTGYVEVKQYGKQPDSTITLLTCERHFFNGSAKLSIDQNPLVDPPSGADITGREAKTEFYKTSGTAVGALLRKAENTWLPGDSQVEGAHVSETKMTLSDTNQVSRQTFSYDRYGNPTDVREYDYGAGGPGPLVRHTHTDYLTTSTIAGVTYDYACDPSTTCSSGSINPGVIYQRSLPRARQVYGTDPSTGAEVIAAKSETRYDESAYPLLTYVGVTVPGWSDPATTARGNATSIRSFINAAATTDPAQACPAGVCVETHARYDQLGNIRYSWDARGNKSEVLYGDSFCNGTTCGSTGYTPNTFAFATSTKTPKPDSSGAYGSANELTVSTVYDFYTGLTYSKTDANNKTAYFEYENLPGQLDRPKAVVRPDGGRTDFYYGDTVGNLYLRTLTDLDPGRRAESYRYFDGLGRPYRKSTYENSVASQAWLNVDTAYDALGRTAMTTMPYRSAGGGAPLTTAMWANAKRVETTYDSLGRVLTVTTRPDGAYAQTDYSGDRVLVKDPAGKERVSRMDALGRLREVWEVTALESGAEASTVALTAFPNHSEAAYGYLTDYMYDALDNLRMVEQAGKHLGQTVTQRRFFAYDSLGRLVRAKNPEQGSFTPDASGGDFPALTDSSSGVSNGSWSTGYGYDANGNLTKRRDARGVTTAYGYDALDRNTTVRYTDSVLGAGNHSQDIDRYYDNTAAGANGLGRFWKTQTSQTALNTTDLYDEAGRAKKQTQQFWTGASWGQSYVVQRSYNKAGGVTSQTYPSGHVVSYNYDAAGRLGDNGSGAAFYGNLGDGAQRTYSSNVTYDELGGMSQERFGTDSPVYNKRLFNSRGQLAEIRVSTYSITAAGHETDWNRGAIINHYSLAAGAWGATGGGPDNNGNLRKQDIYIPNDDAITGYSQSAQSYDYDSLNRLYQARESYGGSNLWVQYYDYDRWGNRTINAANTTGSAPEPQFTVDAATNRLGAPAGQSGVMSYDAAGNLTSDTYQGEGARAHDAENRMTSAQFVSGQTQTALYAYDGDGQRVKRKAGAGDEVWQVYGVGGELLAEYAANASPASPLREYGYRSGELLVTAEPGTSGAQGGATETNAFVTGMTLNSAHRADSAGWTGLKFTTGAQPVTVSSLGRLCSSGNTLSHDLRIVRASDNVTTAASTVTMSGCTAGQFKYAPLASPVTLAANTNYYVVSYEVGSDIFRDWTGTWLTTSSAASITAAIYTTNGGQTWSTATGAGNSYVPVDIKYLPSGTPAEVKWLVSDQLGTPRMSVDKTGSLSGVRRHDYLPFGEELPSELSWRNDARGYKGDTVRQKFTGYERDNEIRLDYAQARYYANIQGRFTSVDPLRGSGIQNTPQSWNRYTYCLNNPLHYVDPSGMQWVHDTQNDLYIWVNDEDYKEGNEYYDNLDRYDPLGPDEIGPNGVTFTLTRGTYTSKYSELAGQQVYLGADGKPHAVENSQGSDEIAVNPTKLLAAALGYMNTGRKLATGFTKLGVAFGVEVGTASLGTLPASVVGIWGLWDLYGSTAAYRRANQQWNEAFNEKWSDASWKNLYGPLPYGQLYDDPSEPSAKEFWQQKRKDFYQRPLEFIREIGSGAP